MLYGNVTLFYLIPLFLVPILYYFLYSDKNYFGRTNLILVLFFCLSLSLITVIGIYKFPYDIDSIYTTQSVLLMISKGFSTQMFSVFPEDFLLKATYPLPINSILASSMTLLTGISYTFIVKYMSLIIMGLFFFSYYTFLSKYFNNKVALISPLLIASFPLVINMGGIFQNVVLAFLFVFLSWILLFEQYFSKKRFSIAILLLILVSTFALTHHLTFTVFILSLIIILIVIYLIKFLDVKLVDMKIPTNFENVILYASIIVLAYYTFVYFSPLSAVLKTFNTQLIHEAASVTAPTTWTLNVIIQRIGFVIFLLISMIFSISYIKKIIEIKENTNKYIFSKQLLFLILGIVILAFSFVGPFFHFPYSWDRTSIFGWIFLIPATISLIDEYNLKNKFLKVIIVLSVAFLIFGNIYALPSNILDHRGDAKYDGSFKNWETNQEYFSAKWLNENSINKTFEADGTFNRVYSVMDPISLQNNYSYSLMGKYYTFKILNNDYNNVTFTYLIIRSENRFYLTGGSSSKMDNLTPNSINKMFSDPKMDLVYNNNEVSILVK
ncbi:MAG: hypothetical protein ABFD07_19320 [Methanobacterium sp.]